MVNTILKFLSIVLASFFLIACSTSAPPINVAENPQPGFSNVTDIPVPDTARMDLDKSIVMGGRDNWTGHLVYTLNHSRVTTIDFLSTQMVARGWARISALRGAETVIVFMKDKRVATFRITGNNKNTLVTVDMANSNAKNVILTTPQQ